jgi:hypothetical protein
MNTYNVYYNRITTEVKADSLYQAKLHAINALKIPKSRQGLVAVLLVQLADGTPVVHSTAEF